MIDLHVHSNCSDGTFSPEELVEYALTHNITAFAITDHDTVAGTYRALSHARLLSGVVDVKNPEGNLLEVIPGIELSTEYEGRDIHIVGLYIDYKSETFNQNLLSFAASRDERNKKMCSLLRKEGIAITYELLQDHYPNAVITRAHYAKYLYENGYVKNMKEAFSRYVGDQAPCFVPRTKVTPTQAVSLIRNAGGIPVLAHPTLYNMSNQELERLVSILKAKGLLAVEGIYPTYSLLETKQIQAIASKYNLLISGGSDFHGNNKPDLQFGTGYGNLYIHEDILIKLKRYL